MVLLVVELLGVVRVHPSRFEAVLVVLELQLAQVLVAVVLLL